MKSKSSPHFSAFTIKFNGQADRIVTDVRLFPAFDPQSYKTPPYPAFSTKALWDTGATKSVITDATAKSMNLVAVGRTKVSHAGGISESNTYLVNIFLPNNVGVAGVLVVEVNNIVGDFGAIIGMDIISGGDFAITNVGGETWMTFRTPSIAHIDYVADAIQVRFAGTPRNAPCPCGSGKKYKQCHGVASTP